MTEQDCAKIAQTQFAIGQALTIEVITVLIAKDFMNNNSGGGAIIDPLPKTYMDYFLVVMWITLSLSMAIYIPMTMTNNWHKYELMKKFYLIIFSGMVLIMCLGALFSSVSPVT